MWKHGELGEDVAPLRNVAHAGIDHLPRCAIGGVAAVELDPARADGKQAEDGLEHGRLAGAVGADHGGDGAAPDPGRGAVEDRHLAVAGELLLQEMMSLNMTPRLIPKDKL